MGAVFRDFTAAFDIIVYKLLTKKFEYYGFDHSSLLWIQSYLTDRAQTVYFDGNYSDIRDVSCGVPQRTCLGPLLYIIFTNDFLLV